VDRVADCSDARDRVIEFEVAKSIPGESADSVAASDPHPLQCASQLLGPAFRLVVGIAVDSALDGSRDDFRFGMIDSRMLEYRRDQERTLRHQTPHRLPPYATLTVFVGQFHADLRSLFRRVITCKCRHAGGPKGR